MDEIGKTLGQLSRETGVPLWKLRRVTDAVAANVRRVGMYRLIDPDSERKILDTLQRSGWLTALQRESLPC